MKEQWRDIKGYEGLYQVSSFGNVKSCDRYVYAGDGNNHQSQHLRERILTRDSRKRCGKYEGVALCKNGKVKRFLVHRLVAQTFIPNPDNLPCVNHKDEDKRNNNVNNLEWCTYTYNNTYNNRVAKCKDKISDTLRQKHLSHKHTEEERKRISESVRRSWILRKQKSAITEWEEVDEHIQ